MKSPFTGKEMIPMMEWRKMEYRKEKFDIVFHCCQCEDTGEQFEDEHCSLLNYNQVVNQYRVKHHIPFPEKIKAIREKYGLSAAKMSGILGMGANSWRNYEGGEVPSKAHANLIQLISLSKNFTLYLQQFSELDQNEKSTILKRVEKLDDDCVDFDDQLLRFENQPDITTGFRSFNREKLFQVIQFFAEELKPFKTKLNKLLFYADFVHFRDTGQSITGLKYTAIQYGPVPNNYDMLFGALSAMDFIDIEYSMTEYGEVERIVPNPEYQFDQSKLVESEMKVIKFIANHFRSTSASKIAEISHRESAWRDNIEEKRVIPFHYAFCLETI